MAQSVVVRSRGWDKELQVVCTAAYYQCDHMRNLLNFAIQRSVYCQLIEIRFHCVKSQAGFVWVGLGR